MSEPKRMSIREFRELGFLQEANRLFFHRYGLALEVTVKEDCSEQLGGIWDYREDPEGIVFGNANYGDSRERADRVAEERSKHFFHRMKMFGTDDGLAVPPADADIEPLEWHYPESKEDAS